MDTDNNLDNELEQNNNILPEDNVGQDEILQEFEEPVVENNATTTDVMADDISENEISDNPQEMITVRPVKFQEFEINEPNRSIKKNLDIMQDVSMHISVELGRAKATIKDVMDYKEGSIVELDKIAGEQVEVYVNNKLVAKGEVIVIEDKFGVRVTSTSLPKNIQ